MASFAYSFPISSRMPRIVFPVWVPCAFWIGSPPLDPPASQPQLAFYYSSSPQASACGAVPAQTRPSKKKRFYGGFIGIL